MYLKLVYKRIYKSNLLKMKNISWEICTSTMAKFHVVKFFILKFTDSNVDCKNYEALKFWEGTSDLA